MVGFRRGLREIVSKKKRRFRDEGFDLDLTYVTDRIIAMGAPCEGVEAIYRNDASDVQLFLETRHQGHYKVLNLCEERESNACFAFVERMPFKDHTPCALDVLVEICNGIDEFLAEHPANVVAIHCKAGKGRTGLLISAYLLHSGRCRTAEEALAMFGDKRTYNGKGVTIPSQIRYAHYYSRLLADDALGGPLRLERVRIVTMPSLGMLSSSLDLYFRVRVWKDRARCLVLVYDHSTAPSGPRKCGVDDPFVDMDCGEADVRLFGDVHLAICVPGSSGAHEVCSIWFNTRFCDDRDGMLCYPKAQIDGANKDRHKRFSPDFEVRLFVSRLSEQVTYAKQRTLEAVDVSNGWWEYTVDSDCESCGPCNTEPAPASRIISC